MKKYPFFFALFIFPHLSWGQSFPNRPVTVVVPHAVAGTNDIVGRILTPPLAKFYLALY